MRNLLFLPVFLLGTILLFPQETSTQKELAKALEIQPSYLNEIIKGKRNINAEIAVKLERIWGIRATFWLNLQAQYEIDLIRIKYRDMHVGI